MPTYRFQIVLRKSWPCSLPGFDEPPDISTLRLRIPDIRQQPLDINKMTQHQTPIPVEPLTDHWLTIWRARLLVCRGKWVAKIMILLLDLASPPFADTFFSSKLWGLQTAGYMEVYIYIYIYYLNIYIYHRFLLHTYINIYVPVLHVSRPPPMVWSPSSNSTTLVLLLVILLVVVLLVVLLPLLLLHSTNTTSIITTTCTSASTMGGYHRMGVGATRRCIIYIFIYTHTHTIFWNMFSINQLNTWYLRLLARYFNLKSGEIQHAVETLLLNGKNRQLFITITIAFPQLPMFRFRSYPPGN